jgi:hypothetical protein
VTLTVDGSFKGKAAGAHGVMVTEDLAGMFLRLLRDEKGLVIFSASPPYHY